LALIVRDSTIQDIETWPKKVEQILAKMSNERCFCVFT